MNRVFKFCNNIFGGSNVSCADKKKPTFPADTNSYVK